MVMRAICVTRSSYLLPLNLMISDHEGGPSDLDAVTVSAGLNIAIPMLIATRLNGDDRDECKRMRNSS